MIKRMSIAAVVLSALSGMAVAADLGGSCCADVDERIAELEATTARKGNRKMSLTVYGQVNQAILYVDAGGETRKSIINNTNEQSRFGFVGEAKIGSGMSAGYLMEIGTASASDAGAPTYGLNIRHSALFLRSESLGTVWLGKTSTATDGIAEIDLSNASVASTKLSLEPLSGSYFAGGNLPFDGNREEVLKYVSPTLAGFTASASWYANKDNAYDMALRWKGEGGGFALAAGVGYRRDIDAFDPTSKAKTLAGSASVMHLSSGLFLSGAYGDIRGAVSLGVTGAPLMALVDAKAAHLQGGIERNWFGIGKTTLFVEAAEVKAGGDTVRMYGGGAVQSIDGAALDLYLSIRDYDNGSIQTGLVGAKIKF